MKRIVIPTFIVLAAAAVAAFFLLQRTAPYRSRGAELAPPQTLLFMHLPDLRTTGERWQKTALHQLWMEPEVQAFVQRPRAKLVVDSGWQAQLERLKRLRPREAFLAIVSIDAAVPKFVGGFSFDGNRKDAEALLAEPRAAVRRARPAGKADLVTYRGTDIEVFTDKELTFVETAHDRWYFVANDLQLLQQTLDRYARTGDAAGTTLAESEVFKKVTRRVPSEHDLLLVLQPAALTDRLAALMAAAGQANSSAVLADVNKTKAIAATTKLDGLKIRDTIFVLSPGLKQEHALERHSLALTSPGTLLHHVAKMPVSLELPESTSAIAGLLVPGLTEMQKSLAEKGVSPATLTKAFGPEFATLLEWPPNAAQPRIVFAFDVRDGREAKTLVDAVAGGAVGIAPWVQTDHAGNVAYSAPTAGFSLIRPTIALTEKFLLFGFSSEAVSTALDHVNSSGPRLDSSAAYSAAAQSVSAPTSAFAWFDFGGVFARAYGTFRPFLVMSMAFMPDAGQYVDVGKLPATDTITRHLTPTVYSQSMLEDGTLIESTGTVTFHQAALGLIGASITAALPTLKNLPLGSLDPGKWLPRSSVTQPQQVDPAPGVDSAGQSSTPNTPPPSPPTTGSAPPDAALERQVP